MAETTLKQFDQPDELREFPNGRFETHDSWVEGGEPYVSLHILAGPPGGAKK